MSFFENQVIGGAGTLIGNFLTIKPSRSFAEFSDFCSVTEAHSSAVQATQYPIEDGTQGTDHIVKLPDVLSWELVFDDRSNPQQTYAKLQDLMFSGEPFFAETGLKTYRNVVLLSISASQDSHTGRILRCSLTLQEILLTSAVTTTLPPRTSQANPQVTGTTAKTGTKNLQDPSPSREAVLSKMIGDIKKFWS